MAGIVVGIDGSENSIDALRWGAQEARLRGSVLHAVTSFAPGLLSTGYEMALPDPADFAAASATMLHAAVDTVREDTDLDGIDIVTEVIEGHAGEVLINLSEKADLLVVGSRGRGGFVGVLMGSITNHVVNHSKCPVVVVR